MEAFERTVSALGNPVSARSFIVGDRLNIVVARWRHGDARVHTAPGDDFRIVLSLGGVQRVTHTTGRCSTSAKGQVGDVGVLSPTPSKEVVIQGDADIFQIFVSAGAFDGLPLGARARETLLAGHDEELRSYMLRLLVATHTKQHDLVMQVIESLLTCAQAALNRDESRRKQHRRGGMSPAKMKHVDDVIRKRIVAPDNPRLLLGELASAAMLSESQLIRAFYRMKEATPYQYILSCRLRAALGILGLAEARIADAADMTGFSSPAHFAASFKRRFGIRPVDYRNAVLDR